MTPPSPPQTTTAPLCAKRRPTSSAQPATCVGGLASPITAIWSFRTMLTMGGLRLHALSMGGESSVTQESLARYNQGREYQQARLRSGHSPRPCPSPLPWRRQYPLVKSHRRTTLLPVLRQAR